MIDLETGEVITPFIRTPYNYNTDEVSQNTGLDCGPESKTQQQFKDEVDINTIVERFTRSGTMPEPMTFPQEQEFEDAFDFQSAMNVTVKARESFMTLPAKVRARFQNNPQEFMQFIHNEENFDEAIKMGIATKRPEEPKPPFNSPDPVENKENKKEK